MAFLLCARRRLLHLCRAPTSEPTSTSTSTGVASFSLRPPSSDLGPEFGHGAPSQAPRTCIGMMKKRSGFSWETPAELGPPTRRCAADAVLVVGFSVLALWLDQERKKAHCQEEARDEAKRHSYEEDEEGEKEEEEERVSITQAPPEEVKSNVHTAKWRIFTDKARKLSSQGLYDAAETYFYKALEEARLGFGEEDPHVASCYNNLAELFRLKKDYEKAERLYNESISRLRKSSGLEDGSVGFALHNLGGFYVTLRQLDRAQQCYEEALKIKGRALGLDHPEYANTMFHLGEVIRLRGDGNGGVDLMQNSIKILEHVGLGNTAMAIKRRSRLSEVLFSCGRLGEAEANQRKALQILELSKEASSEDIVAGLELLIFILLRQAKYTESESLLEQCIAILRGDGSRNDHDVRLASCLWKLGGLVLLKGRKVLASSGDKPTALERYQEAEKLVLEAARIGEMKWRESCSVIMVGDESLENRNKKEISSCERGLLLWIRSLITLGEIGFYKLDVVTDSQAALAAHKHAEEALQRAMELLDDTHVQAVVKPADVKQFRKKCSEHISQLHSKA